MNEPNEWMTQAEAAAYLRCSTRQVRRLPLAKSFVGDSPRYELVDLEAYLQRRKVTPRDKKKAAPPRAAHRRSSSEDGWDTLDRAFRKRR